MKHYYLYTLLLCTTLAASCEGPMSKLEEKKQQDELASQPRKKFNGEKLTYYDNGAVKSRVNFVNGRMHGKAFNYYKSGKVHSEFEYTNGAHAGTTRWYFESGKLYQEIPYENDMKHGLFKQYFENGQVEAELPYFEDYEGLGLKEYSSKGELKTRYPKLNIKELGVNEAMDTVGLKLSLSEKHSSVQYFYGELTDDKYLNDRMTQLYAEDGEAIMVLPMPKPGSKLQYDIVAMIKTPGNFAYLAHKKYTVPSQL